MQLHQIKPNHKLRRSKRIGRGGKRGTTSGRGQKGQKSRAGHKIKPVIRDVIQKLPKLRGFKFRSFRLKPVVLNLEKLEKSFQNGEKVSPDVLLNKGLIGKVKGKMPDVKILGQGNLTKKLDFSDLQFSKSAREKVIKSGGIIK